MRITKICPVCSIENEEIELSVHLMASHHWTYQETMDWVRKQEEACEK